MVPVSGGCKIEQLKEEVFSGDIRLQSTPYSKKIFNSGDGDAIFRRPAVLSVHSSSNELNLYELPFDWNIFKEAEIAPAVHDGVAVQLHNDNSVVVYSLKTGELRY